MNCVFAYTSKSSSSHSSGYGKLLQSFMKGDFLKMWALLAFFFAMFFIYTIAVNVSSTQWYYYSQAVKSQEKVNFQHNITKLNVMTMQSNLRNTISFDVQNGQNNFQEVILLQ